MTHGQTPARVPIRRDTGAWGMQRALARRGFDPVAGVDEAGRGACAGPLVVAACALRYAVGDRLCELTDSKSLAPEVRERVYAQVIACAQTYSIVVIGPEEVDRDGVHAANIAGMRQSVARLERPPGYVLTDGFAVQGLAAPSLPVIKGDATVACVAAASVLAKVTRDRLMRELHDRYPRYGFDAHKGYSTVAHGAALATHGPSVVHRWSYANVAAAAQAHGRQAPWRVTPSEAAVRARDEAPSAEPCSQLWPKTWPGGAAVGNNSGEAGMHEPNSQGGVPPE